MWVHLLGAFAHLLDASYKLIISLSSSSFLFVRSWARTELFGRTRKKKQKQKRRRVDDPVVIGATTSLRIHILQVGGGGKTSMTKPKQTHSNNFADQSKDEWCSMNEQSKPMKTSAMSTSIIEVHSQTRLAGRQQLTNSVHIWRLFCLTRSWLIESSNKKLAGMRTAAVYKPMHHFINTYRTQTILALC